MNRSLLFSTVVFVLLSVAGCGPASDHPAQSQVQPDYPSQPHSLRQAPISSLPLPDWLSSSASAAPDSASFSIGSMVTVRGMIGASESAGDCPSNEPVFTAVPGEQYRLEAYQENYVQIRQQDRSGWIPAWYLADGEERIREVPPFPMITGDSARLLLYPNEKEQTYGDSEPGRVVRVSAEYGSKWYRVSLTMYAEPCMRPIWVEKQALLPFQSDLAKEGRLKPDTVVLDETGAAKESFGSSPVFVLNSKEEKLAVAASGGRFGYVDRSAFLPNPFWTDYESDAYQVSFEYPSHWKANKAYENRFQAEDGFVQISAGLTGQWTIQDAAAHEASHKLKPFGSRPEIRYRQADGQEAALILPSEDQDKSEKGLALLLVRYPAPVSIRGESYLFLYLLADRDHIESIADTVQFRP
ncbi:hypothetical protein [Brevibacillus borstelensis]|uniref:hypothetical protein n=1 Tax=Brevibacillus borstelensis TaxID=45462 RepID=UPI0030BB5B04